MSLSSGWIRLLTLELLALEWRKFYTSKLEYLWGQLASLHQILCVASLGVGKGCILFWGRLDQNSGVIGNRKPALTYNGENGASTFSRLLLIGSFLYLQVMRTCIKSRMSLNFGQIGPLTTELTALERLKNFSYRPIMGKWCLHASSFILYRIIFKVPGNHQDRHFGPNQTTQYGVTCPWVKKISHFWMSISLKPVGQSWSNFMFSIIVMGERLHKVLGQIDFGTLDSGERSLPFGLLVSFSNIQTLKIFVTLFSVTVRPRLLKLGAHVDNEWMYCVSGSSCIFVSLFFHFSSQFSNIKMFLSHFSQELWGLEGWNVIPTWTVGRWIVYTERFHNIFLQNCKA